jgi:hypothetical protein
MPGLVLLAVSAAGPLAAQQHDQAAQQHDHAAHGAPAGVSEPGQSAFAAIAEVVRILEADPGTDWSRVDIEALRAHLADMDAVTLRSRVSQTAVPGGARFEVTGDSATAAAIRRMTRAHLAELNRSPELQGTVEEIPHGAAMTVVARRRGDSAAETKIRGLGFIGLMTLGGHHGPHHLALARGGHPHH